MWRGLAAETEPSERERPHGHFRPRISSISGVLASVTRQKFFTPPATAIKDEVEPHSHPSSSVNPVSFDTYSFDNRINGQCLTGVKATSPTRSSYGDLVAYSRSPSARPSIDSTNAQALYALESGDTIGDSHEQANSDEDDTGDSKCTERTKKSSRGVVCTILISLAWVGTLHLLKLSYISGMRPPTTAHPVLADSGEDMYNDSESNAQSTATPQRTEGDSSRAPTFDAPFFMAWYCSMWNVLFLPIYTFSKICSCCFNKEKTSTKKIFVESVHHLMEKGFTPLQFFIRCGFFCILWILTNYLLIYTLRILDTTVVMALFACTVTLCYLLSWVVLHQQFVGIRIVAVIICDTGIALLAYMDGTTSRSGVLGAVVLAAGAALGSSVYKVFYKRMIGYASFGEMSLFFTLIGFLTAFLMWPMVLLLYFTGAETLVWDHIPWLKLSGAAGLNLTANLLGNFGLIWTYELFLSLGVLFAIPISSVIDASVYDVEFKQMKLGGILLIMFGFIVVLLPDNWNGYLADILRSRLAKWKRNEQLKKNGARVQDTSTAQLSRLRTPSGRVK